MSSVKRWQKPSPEERFWQKVEKGPSCWLWIAGIKTSGYGAIYWFGGPQLAHRVAYQLLVGPIPDGAVLMHSCDNRLCVNPDHLMPGTIAENNADMHAKGRNKPSPLRGEQMPSAKLTEQRVRDMRQQHASGVRLGLLGERFGVSREVAWKAVTRRTWRHVA